MWSFLSEHISPHQHLVLYHLWALEVLQSQASRLHLFVLGYPVVQAFRGTRFPRNSRGSHWTRLPVATISASEIGIHPLLKGFESFLKIFRIAHLVFWFADLFSLACASPLSLTKDFSWVSLALLRKPDFCSAVIC